MNAEEEYLTEKKQLHDESVADNFKSADAAMDAAMSTDVTSSTDANHCEQTNSSDEVKVAKLQLDLAFSDQNLKQAELTVQDLKSERRELKTEKLDLLNQIKQLYCTLEEKETELRDFIRNYGQRMQEADKTIKQLNDERSRCEREIVNRNCELSERETRLREQLDKSEQTVRQLQKELRSIKLARQHSAKLGFTEGDRSNSSLQSMDSSCSDPTLSPPTLVTISPNTTPPPLPPDLPVKNTVQMRHPTSNAVVKSRNNIHDEKKLQSRRKFEPIQAGPDKITEGVYVQIAPEQTDVSHARRSRSDHIASDGQPKKRSSLSKLFSKGCRSKSNQRMPNNAPDDGSRQRVSMLSKEDYQQKLRLIQESREIPPGKWKASHVLAWIEVELNMPAYGKLCSENIKSGKILLNMNDADLDAALLLKTPLHKRKLRIAIDELRNPNTRLYPGAAQLDHTWVSQQWLRDIGLPCYRRQFHEQLVCGRLLPSLSRRDLERQLGVRRRFHQTSLLHAVALLRHVAFRRDKLDARRERANEVDCDPIVWTNQRVVRWLHDIDLGEYASNLEDSGINGALLVLEADFNAESLGNLLGIPASKTFVRRHLASELATIITPARAALNPAPHTCILPAGRPPTQSPSYTTGLDFQRSFKDTTSPLTEMQPKKPTFRGSFGRALGRKASPRVDEGLSQSVSNGRPSILTQHKRSLSVSSGLDVI